MQHHECEILNEMRIVADELQKTTMELEPYRKKISTPIPLGEEPEQI